MTEAMQQQHNRNICCQSFSSFTHNLNGYYLIFYVSILRFHMSLLPCLLQDGLYIKEEIANNLVSFTVMSTLKKSQYRDIPGSLEVKTSHSQFRGHRFDSWSGN